MAKRRFAGEAIAELKEAMLPIAQQQGKRGDPYNVGSMDEKSWINLQDFVHQGIQNGTMDQNVIQEVLKLKNNSGELKRFMDWSLARNRRGYFHNDVSRHVHYGVPHAWSSENVYNELLKANGFNSRFNNQVDDTATDLIATINGKDKLIDVQNRGGIENALSLGLFHNLSGNNDGLGLAMWKQGNGKKLSTIFEDVRGNLDHKLSSKEIDKLGASVELVGDKLGKEILIGGRYQPGDVSNLIGNAAKGGYDFSKPRDIHNIDLAKLRNEMMRMTKEDLLDPSNGVQTIRDRDKLKFTIPMDFVEKLGALNNGMIDPELIELVRR